MLSVDFVPNWFFLYVRLAGVGFVQLYLVASDQLLIDLLKSMRDIYRWP